MTSSWEMPNIFLLSCDEVMKKAWDHYFHEEDKVRVECNDFERFIDSFDENTAIVSPANSYGFMDGGYDAAITAYFGSELEELVQQRIFADFLGEQPPGTGLLIDIPNCRNMKLIHIPTMKLPEPILDSRIIYHCMRTALIISITDRGISNVVIPAFGALTGEVPATIVAKQMYAAYLQIKAQVENPHIETWNTAIRHNMQILKMLNEH